MSKARGQHLVVDPNTVRRVARLAGVGPGDRVVEVGPGLGALTLALAETGASVTAVEIDHRLAAALGEVVAALDVTVVVADALRVDWNELLGGEEAGDPAWSLVANLPYNVATPLVAGLLDDVPAVGRMLVMVQREVAERLAARPGSEAYGAVSVKVAYWARAEVVGAVPRSVFLPEPSVDSALVRVERRADVATDWPDLDRRWLFELVAAGFGQRRKMLRRSLATLVPPEAFEAAGVPPSSRPEELGVEDWARLARCTKRPGRPLPPSAPAPS